ncbi:MAG: MMPL family transporter [Actinomycetota bacterium]|nr:MMPL family transporter [Actinomycetota bacterium]
MGRWSAGHRKTAIFGWLAFVAVAVAIGAVVGTKALDDEDANVRDSGRAEAIIDRGAYPESAEESVLVQSRSATATDPVFRAVVRQVAQRISRLEGVTEVRSPLDRENGNLVSADRHSAIVQFDVAGDDTAAEPSVEKALAAVESIGERNPGYAVEEFGGVSAGMALDETIGKDFDRAEYLALPITLGILIVVFGALVAAGIPLLLGLSAVMAAIGLLSIPSHWFPMDDASNSVILLIGLAVGVDYSLFYLKREREERAAGRGKEAALEAAAATSGRAVLISGLTVIAALAGLFLGGTKIWTSIAIGTILVVAIAVAGSLTVLPAMLSWLGDRVERGRIPLVHRLRRADGNSRVWAAILDRVLRRPLVSAAAAASFLVVLALPTLGLHTSLPGAAALPDDLPVMQTYNRIQAAFPGGPLPAAVAIETDDVTAPEVRAAIADLRDRALATGLMDDPIQVDPSPNRRVAVISVPLAGEGAGDATSERALAVLREDVLPAAFAGTGVEFAVTGETAASEDFNELMKDRAPLVFAFVLGLAFVLLLVSFRSVVIAGKAIVLNLLSVAAAYGLLVAVFQWGWGESLLGFESTGAITAWLPVFMFVILFGLSMDYHVFILSRIREAYDRGLRTEDAVAYGIKTTAGVVSAAAFVMVAVFAIFVTLSTVEMKQAGFGLSTAVLIDATIVRAVLLPAAMKLLGDWNWYLPRWLQWLPQVSHETEAPRGIPVPSPAGR